MARKSIIALIIGILFILIGKDYLLKFALTRYINHKFGQRCTIQQAKMSLNGIAVENLHLFDKDIDLKIKEGAILFRLVKPFSLKISQIIVRQLSIRVDNLTKVKSALDKRLSAFTNSQYGQRYLGRGPFSVSLDNITINLQERGRIKLYTDFSFKGLIKNNNIEEIKYFTILRFDAQFKNLAVSNATLTDAGEDNYVLTIPQVKIGNKEIAGFRLPLRITSQGIELRKEKQDFFGPTAYAGGSLTVKSFGDVCLNVELFNASFAKVINLLTNKESISFTGLFDGKIDMCFKGAKLLKLSGSFSNNEGGIINIEKDAPLDLLKKHLEQASYKALIDNFRNYQYNKGTIEIAKNREMVTLKMKFHSSEGGRRNLIINFHNILGGEE